MNKRRRLTKAERQEVYDKYDGHCAYCGCELELKDMQVDHLEPLFGGGMDAVDNYMPACRMCNHYKSVYVLEDFRGQLGKLIARLTERVYIFRLALMYGLIKITGEPVEFYFEKVDNGKTTKAANA